jgi:hypothetical protein
MASIDEMSQGERRCGFVISIADPKELATDFG